MHHKKILFITKKRHLTYPSHGEYGETNASGLFNSIRFISEMLGHLHIKNKVVQVDDNNDIDREVSIYHPDIVIIEALWVVPEKFKILHKLHPNVKWIIRLHSEIPFIAMEGVAMDWLFNYAKHHYITIAANAPRMVHELESLLKQRVLYLPNTYPVTHNHNSPKHDSHVINISCFGAVRPLKNHLMQAVAALDFANSIEKTLHFHINGTRVEGKGDPVLKNIQNLFEHEYPHKLIQHSWMPHHEFIEVVKNMDIGMQVSFSETYNIVSADHVNQNIPMVTSSEVKFVLPFFHAKPTDACDITNKLYRAWVTSKFGIQKLNKLLLKQNSTNALKTWIKELYLK